MGFPASAKGTYTGTTALLSVNIGFRPALIHIWNETDGDKYFMHIDGMGAAKAYMINDSGSGATDLSVIATNAITVNDRGFSVGTDSDLNESAKVYRFSVVRES